MVGKFIEVTIFFLSFNQNARYFLYTNQNYTAEIQGKILTFSYPHGRNS